MTAATLEPTAGGAAVAACPHCGASSSGAPAGVAPFCCIGCQGAYAFLRAANLDRYYALRDGPGRPVQRSHAPDHKWLTPLVAAVLATPDGTTTRLDLDIQGVHCSACVWLLERLFARAPARGSIVVNPAIGRIQLLVGRGFDLAAFVAEVERLGYLLGPARKSEARASNDLIWRMGVCVAIAMNTMIFAIAFYAGLASGPLYVLFQRLNLGLSAVALAVGGSVFLKSSLRGLARGLLHLDTPIALGVLLAFGGSVYSYACGQGAASYVDTINVFIALMLVGRWLRERVLERNRLEVLASDGADGLLTRVRRGDRVVTVPCTQVEAGDILVLSPGDLVPVDARLAGGRSESCSLDWINGESRPRPFAPGSVLPAGAFFAGQAVVEVEATRPFAGSALVELLRTPVRRDADGAMETPWWQRLTRYYVAAVLVLASIGAGGWLLATHDAVKAVAVATAVLIVTCPCAFGLATPLAYDLAQARLRRAGLYVRAPGFLDRATAVRTVVFDKTGTLTLAAARITNEGALRGLPADAKAALSHIVARSHHPKSVAVRAALARLEGGREANALEVAGPVVEWAGLGVEMAVGGRTFRLGAPAWAAARDHGGDLPACDLVFGEGGRALAELGCDEALRDDAQAEVAALRGEGYDVWLLSGDDPARVRDVAERCGIAPDHAVGGASPEGKDAWLAAHDRGDVLMVGDGINDTLVVEHASCSGPPAIDRPVMAARSDGSFTTPGLAPGRGALPAARAVATVRSLNLTIAVAYNVVAVALAYAGLMSPLLCAVFMPLSSLSTLGATRVALSPGSRLWKS